MENNANVQVTSMTQPGNEVLGTEDKTLYYLIIQNGNGKVIVNIGLKNYTEIKKLCEVKKGGKQ